MILRYIPNEDNTVGLFKGRVSHFFFILAQVMLGIIYDGKIVKMGRSDRKMVKDKKN